MNHEDLNSAVREVEDKHYWLVEYDGLVFGSQLAPARAGEPRQENLRTRYT